MYNKYIKINYGDVLSKAIQNCDKQAVVDLLNEKKNEINFCEYFLHQAVWNGDLEVFKTLLEAGFDKERKNTHGETSLIAACSLNKLDIVKLLVSSGADKEAKDKYNRTPLITACAGYNKIEVVEFLLQSECDIHTRTLEGRTPFIYSAYCGAHLSIFKLLLKYGANKDDTDNTGKTALHYACLNNDSKLVEYLLNSGCKRDIVCYRNFTPLMYTAINSECQKLLLKPSQTHERYNWWTENDQ